MKKAIIILSVLVFVLLAGIELYVQSDVFARRIRPFVVDSLKAALGEGAQIGWVRANFIPLYLEARDITIPDPQGKQLIAIHKVKIYVNPLPLIFKKVRLSSILVLDPRVYVERSSEGSLNLAPLIERIKANAAAAAPPGSSRFTLLLRTITIRNGQVEFRDAASSLMLSAAGIGMTARVDLSQERARVALKSAQIQLSAPAYPLTTASLKASFEYEKGAMHIDTIEVATADASVTLSGDTGPLPDATMDLRLQVRSGPKVIKKIADLLKPTQKQESSRIEASARIRGKMSAPVVDGSFKVSAFSFGGMALRDVALAFEYRDRIAVVRNGKGTLHRNGKSIVISAIDAAFRYETGGLNIEKFEVMADDLSLACTGRADPAKGLDLSLDVNSSGKGRTLSILTSVPLEGRIEMIGAVSGSFSAPVFSGMLDATKATVRNIPFARVSGKIGFSDRTIKLSSVDISEGGSSYILDGSVDLRGKEPAYTARLKVVRSDVVNIVALFYEQLPLHLSAEGELTFEGTAQNYSGTGYLKLGPGSAYGESFTRGAIFAKLTTNRISFPQVVLNKERGLVKGTGWIGFEGTYSADLESRDVDLANVDLLAGAPARGEFKLDVHSSGTFTQPSLNASLSVEALTYSAVPLGGMSATAEIRNDLLTLNASLSEERAHALARWRLTTPYAWIAEANVRSGPIDPFSLLGKADLAGSVTMVAEGSATARGKGLDASSITGKASFQKLSMVIGDFRIDNESDAQVSLDQGTVTATSVRFTGSGTKIAVTGSARPGSSVDLSLQGAANLSLLRLLYHEIEHAGGTADVKLTIRDEWNNPDIAGELRVQNGEIKVKDVPQRFTSLNGRIALAQGRIVAEQLTGEMGGGAMSVSGAVQLAGVALKDFSLKASMEHVTVRYPEGLTSTLSGDLYYDGDLNEQSLSGDVTIKKARYDKRIEWKTMLVDVGRGLYQKKKTDVGWIGDTRINVRFHGTNDILFQNNLGNMALDVDVFLRGTVNHPYLLGRIEARKGLVYFRKNDFKILHASADFVDPGRMNPVLDIQAETRVREYTIRLAVTGTAERAVVTFISDPSLIDTDILGLLALGKKGTELKGKESGVGAGEAASFATGQFQDIFESRARSLTGLDRFQVDPYMGKSDTSVPRLTVSKELVQNKLYMTYSSNVGASAPEQIFRIEYLLDRHFSVVGERDETGNTGADFKYRFEFK